MSSMMQEDASAARSSLAALVNARRTATGKSYRTIADEAGVAISTVHKIASGALTRMPQRKTLTGIADALGVPVESLIEAGLADMGIREFVLEEGQRRSIYVATADLTPAECEVVLTMINAIVGRRRRERS